VNVDNRVSGKILCTSHYQECGEAEAYLSVAQYLGRLLYVRQARARRRLKLDTKIRQRMVEHNNIELPTNRQLSH
jgi:hypothetical protein